MRFGARGLWQAADGSWQLWSCIRRTQRYGMNAQTSVYRSINPLYFGIDDDRSLVCTLPIAAPEIIRHEGQDYIAYLNADLKGIQMAKLK